MKKKWDQLELWTELKATLPKHEALRIKKLWTMLLLMMIRASRTVEKVRNDKYFEKNKDNNDATTMMNIKRIKNCGKGTERQGLRPKWKTGTIHTTTMMSLVWKGRKKILLYTYRDVDDTAQYSIVESYLQCEGSWITKLWGQQHELSKWWKTRYVHALIKMKNLHITEENYVSGKSIHFVFIHWWRWRWWYSRV